MKRFRTYLPIIYILLLILSYFYITNMLDTVKVKELDEEKEQVEEVKPVVVNLRVEGPFGVLTYRERMQNTDSFSNLLEKLREQGVTYERELHTYGVEYIEVMDHVHESDMVWRLYENNEEFTYNPDDISLKDEATYRMVLAPK